MYNFTTKKNYKKYEEWKIKYCQFFVVLCESRREINREEDVFWC